MKNRSSKQREPQIKLLRVELVRLLDMNPEMVKLAGQIDWKSFEERFDSI